MTPLNYSPSQVKRHIDAVDAMMAVGLAAGGYNSQHIFDTEEVVEVLRYLKAHLEFKYNKTLDEMLGRTQ